jgi:hypothetical protein
VHVLCQTRTLVSSIFTANDSGYAEHKMGI